MKKKVYKEPKLTKFGTVGSQTLAGVNSTQSDSGKNGMFVTPS